MIVVVPPHVTCPDVTSIVSTVELSEVFLMRILPVPAETTSEKVMIRLVSTRTSIALSSGESERMVGDVKSTVVKFHLVVLAIPANGVFVAFLKAQAATWT